MASHPYGLRSRLNTQSPSVRTTPSASPVLPKTGGGAFRRLRTAEVSLSLQKVIGTTTNSPSGLSCCPAINSYAYCAGAVAVLAKVEPDNAPSHRYYKARPTAPSLNPPTSHYESSPANTPSKRRTSTFTPRKGHDDVAGGSFSREWLDESGGHTWTARERIKAASCVSLSRDGRWLAVGEAGYNPRVLLFSTADDSSCEIPTSIVCDHTYGVRCIAFSPDMKYLATLGNFNDGFLFIWMLNQKTGQLALHSANKCTTSVSDMAWCGNNLVTVGTRHVKLWHLMDPAKRSPMRQPRFRRSDTLPSSPGPKPLSGRNCLLGSMVDSTFTSVLPVDDTIIILGTETGHLCLIDTSQTVLELKVLKKFDISITSIAYLATTQQVLLGTTLGLHTEDLAALRKREQSAQARSSFGSINRKAPRASAVRRSLGLLSATNRHVTAIGTVQEHTITLDSEGSLQIERSQTEDGSQSQPIFAAHNSIIQGVQSLPSQANLGDFFTWSKNGEIKFWDTTGALLNRESLDLSQIGSDGENFENELSRMQYAVQLNGFLAGDRFGILRLIQTPDWRLVHTIRAHSAEVTGMAVHHTENLIATCSRDRMIQLFQVENNNFELLQTMDDHVGAVNQILFASNGEKLFSCSTDRSLIIRERVLRDQGGVQSCVYLSTKVLTLKASPLSMTLSADNLLLVSTMDRRITKVDFTAGILMDSYKLGDFDSDDTVFLNSIICSRVSEGGDSLQKVVIGYCSMDKSIRVYNEKNLNILGKESGHTEGVSDITVLDQSIEGAGHRCRIVSTGLDGTIMIWSLSRPSLVATQETSPERPQGLGISTDDPESPGVKPSPASLPPLRKVLTKMDITELTRPNIPLSPSSPRSLSPVRLKRKTSRLALSTTVEDIEETPTKPVEGTALSKSPKGERLPVLDPRPSPSPPSKMNTRPRLRRSRTELSKEMEDRTSTVLERSPSPPAFTIAVPTTPKNRQKPNNGRLRRPPSVPTDLRAHAMAQGRRQSMSQASDFGSLNMATEQACRMLKTYRRKLNNSKEVVDLDDLEDEILVMMKVIRERKDRTPAPDATKRNLKAKAATENDVDHLTVLMQRAKVTDTTVIGMNEAREMMESKA